MKQNQKLNGKQRSAVKKFEAISGFEFMHIDSIASGEMTFREAWNRNIKWMEDLLAEITNINTNGCGMYR